MVPWAAFQRVLEYLQNHEGEISNKRLEGGRERRISEGHGGFDIRNAFAIWHLVAKPGLELTIEQLL